MSLPAAARPVSFILTADRAKTMPFYAEVLGLPVIAEEAIRGRLRSWQRGNAAAHRHQGSRTRPAHGDGLGSSRHPDRHGRAQGKSVTFEIYEGFGQDAQGVWSFKGTHLAWFNDPEGNNLSLAQHES